MAYWKDADAAEGHPAAVVGTILGSPVEPWISGLVAISGNSRFGHWSGVSITRWVMRCVTGMVTCTQ